MHPTRLLPLLLALPLLGCQPTPPPATPNDPPLRTAHPGDLLTIPHLDPDHLPPIPLTKKPDSRVQFLFSDKPEYFRTGDGISLQEPLTPGPVRLYIYHCPDPKGGPKTISAVLENKSDHPLHLHFTAASFPKPTNYPNQAVTALTAYFNHTSNLPPRTIPPHQRVVLDPKMDAFIATKDILVHGLYEFTVDQPAQVTVFERDPTANSLTVIDTLPKLPHILPGQHESGAGRGHFWTSDYDVSLSTDAKDGPHAILLADGQSDPWVQGRDNLTGIQGPHNQNKGNYGVIYHLHLTYKSSNGQALALLLTNPRAAGPCGPSAAAMKVNDHVVRLPTHQNTFRAPPQAVLIATLPPPPAGQTREIDLTFSPPGASCLPLPIVILPYAP